MPRLDDDWRRRSRDARPARERHIAYVVSHQWPRSAADYTCNRCDRLYSAEYVRLQTIERRVYRAETGYRPVLERAPRRLEAYTLCIRCSNKPFTGYSAQQPFNAHSR